MNFVNLKKCLMLSTAVLAFVKCANASDNSDYDIFKSPIEYMQVVDQNSNEKYEAVNSLIVNLSDTSKELLNRWDNNKKIDVLAKYFNINKTLINDDLTLDDLFNAILCGDSKYGVSSSIADKYPFVQKFFNIMGIIKFIVDNHIATRNIRQDVLYKLMYDVASTCNIDRALKLVENAYYQYKNNNAFDIVQEVVRQLINNSETEVSFQYDLCDNGFSVLCARLFGNINSGVFFQSDNGSIVPRFYKSIGNSNISDPYDKYYKSLNIEQNKLSVLLAALGLKYLYLSPNDRLSMLGHKMFDQQHEPLYNMMVRKEKSIGNGEDILSYSDFAIFLLKCVNEFDAVHTKEDDDNANANINDNNLVHLDSNAENPNEMSLRRSMLNNLQNNTDPNVVNNLRNQNMNNQQAFHTDPNVVNNLRNQNMNNQQAFHLQNSSFQEQNAGFVADFEKQQNEQLQKAAADKKKQEQIMFDNFYWSDYFKQHGRKLTNVQVIDENEYPNNRVAMLSNTYSMKKGHQFFEFIGLNGLIKVKVLGEEKNKVVDALDKMLPNKGVLEVKSPSKCLLFTTEPIG